MNRIDEYLHSKYFFNAIVKCKWCGKEVKGKIFKDERLEAPVYWCPSCNKGEGVTNWL